MKKWTIILIFCLVLCGCNAANQAASTETTVPSPLSLATSWSGTWSGKVDWVSVSSSSSDPSNGDSVTITIDSPVASSCNPPTACSAAYTLQFTGTNTGPELGNVGLIGSFLISETANCVACSSDLTEAIVSPSINGDPYSNAIQSQETWQLSGTAITITGIGTNAQGQSISLLMGTLTKQ
jgi:hypothetical protein